MHPELCFCWKKVIFDMIELTNALNREKAGGGEVDKGNFDPSWPTHKKMVSHLKQTCSSLSFTSFNVYTSVPGSGSESPASTAFTGLHLNSLLWSD